MQVIKSNSIILHTFFTNNNILCTITNLKGEVLLFISTGSYKLKGLKKITSTAIFSLGQTLWNYVKNHENLFLYVKIKGTNKSKNEFLKSLKILNFNVLLIQEKFSLPHGGCKKSRQRKI